MCGDGEPIAGYELTVPTASPGGVARNPPSGLAGHNVSAFLAVCLQGLGRTPRGDEASKHHAPRRKRSPREPRLSAGRCGLRGGDGGSDCDHRTRHRGPFDVCDRRRHGQPGRPDDHLVRRVRNQHELRQVDRVEERRLRDRQRPGLGFAHRARPEHHLSLPPRRDERRGHEPRRGRHLQDLVRARGGHGRGFERHRDVGGAGRHRRPERPGDDLVLRVRNQHELRLQDGLEERRIGYGVHRGLGSGGGPGDRAGLPLPPRRDERRGHEPWRGSHAHNGGRAFRGNRFRLRDHDEVGEARRNRHAQRPGDQLVLRVRHDQAYGSKTSAKSAGPGAKAVGVSITVTGLKAATAYHYRLVAANGSGTSVGADRVFATAGPPIARTGIVLDLGPNSARPTGSVNPQGRRTTWWFEYGATTRYGSRTASRSAGSAFGEQGVSASITRPRTAASYHYRLVARNDAGTTRGADLTFTTSGVSLNARSRRVVFGRGVMLSGVVPTRRAGEMVTLIALDYGLGSTRVVATVLTGEGGIWRYLARPTIRTDYTAGWNGATSRAITIAVRPAVSFRRVGRARFATRVVAARSFAGRIVKLKRRTAAGRWVTVKRLRLNRRSAATVRVRLRRRTSRLRVVMSVNQVGPGYLAGISRTIIYRRR